MSNRKIVISEPINTLEEFKDAMIKISNLGFVKAHRRGPTSIGKTLEDLLGIEENCISTPDIGTVELKSARMNTNSMLTLTTKSPDIRGSNSWLRDNYGYKTDESIELNPNLNILHSTINGIGFNNLHGNPYLKLTFKDNRMYLEHAIDGVLDKVYWSEDSLLKAFKKKYPQEKMYYVKADSKLKDGHEYFHYREVYYLEHFSAHKMLEHLKEGIIDIDIRIGIYTGGKNKGKSHDHGTGIRIKPNYLELCFDRYDKIM